MKTYQTFDPSSIEWYSVYQQQGRGDIHKYVGTLDHRGYGFMSSMVRFLIPILKTVGAEVGKQFIDTGAKTLSDVASGVPPTEAIKNRGKEGLHSLLKKGSELTVGRGRKRKNIAVIKTNSSVIKRSRNRGLNVYKL